LSRIRDFFINREERLDKLKEKNGKNGRLDVGFFRIS
jgi:hypothetical protein